MGAALSELMRAITSICQDASLHASCCSDSEACVFAFDSASQPQAEPREHDLSLETACCTLTLHDGEPLEIND